MSREIPAKATVPITYLYLGQEMPAVGLIQSINETS